MATTYKAFLNNDIASTRTMLHEAIPITGSIISGTYGTFPDEENIKNYAHGMFQSVYDYPYLSSSANHIFDLTVGYSTQSGIPADAVQNSKKINIYNQMAQVLMGYDATGSILRFDQDGNIDGGGTKHDACVFINFARLLTKDEIKKGSFSLSLGGATAFATALNSSDRLIITDSGAENAYFINSPAGEYGILSCSIGGGYDPSANGLAGLLFYQAGIAVLTASIFNDFVPGTGFGKLDTGADAQMNVGGDDIDTLLETLPITASCDAIRHRWFNNNYNNTTELNSTIHFCRINNNDYNYSSNPTYLSASKMVVKNNTLDAPISYLTTVGLYSADNELLATAKLSEPLKKDPTNEMTLRVRLDY